MTSIKAKSIAVILGLCIHIYFNSMAIADEGSKKNAVRKNASNFPWELVTEKGKINGCIYKNEFYSVGSIIVAEKLPIKCKINPARDGIWSELDDGELQLYIRSVKQQERLAAQSLKIGDQPINHFEASVIRSIRKANQ